MYLVKYIQHMRAFRRESQRSKENHLFSYSGLLRNGQLCGNVARQKPMTKIWGGDSVHKLSGNSSPNS